jgi:hypothetical protein
MHLKFFFIGMLATIATAQSCGVCIIPDLCYAMVNGYVRRLSKTVLNLKMVKFHLAFGVFVKVMALARA